MCGLMGKSVRVLCECSAGVKRNGVMCFARVHARGGMCVESSDVVPYEGKRDQVSRTRAAG